MAVRRRRYPAFENVYARTLTFRGADYGPAFRSLAEFVEDHGGCEVLAVNTELSDDFEYGGGVIVVATIEHVSAPPHPPRRAG